MDLLRLAITSGHLSKVLKILTSERFAKVVMLLINPDEFVLVRRVDLPNGQPTTTTREPMGFRPRA